VTAVHICRECYAAYWLNSFKIFVLSITDISWQTALAHSAVSAAEDVGSTVRAARTAANAKSAATSAAHSAQVVVEKGKFANIDEARAAQTRASIAQSHAIHAAVVEHEAKTVKRRATLALAHDVKCWNVHRKREVLDICLSYAKSQHEATRRAVDAWSCLRDGFVGSNIIPSAQARRAVPQNRKPRLLDLMCEEAEVEATIFSSSDHNEGRPSIVAVEHELLKLPCDSSSSCDSTGTGDIITAPAEPETILPLVVASPIPEEDEDVSNSRSQDTFDIFGACHSDSSSQLVKSSCVHSPSVNASRVHPSETEAEEVLTSSMQSLVDGLMNWGGIDVEEDFALPAGMAASIALEESAVFATKQSKIN
jgi:hypothetical protein